MRFIASWVLYWLGDLASKTMHWFNWTAFFLYPVYNRLIGWSVDIQGEGNGPWERV